MKKGSFLVIGVLTASLAFGQEYEFKVLANKGNSEVKSGGAWLALKTGATLKPEDELKVTENSYLGLVHKTGKPLEVKEAGSYSVADLTKRIKGGTSVLNKYTDFILSSNSAEAKKNRLVATGAVHRGLPEDVTVFLPENSNSYVYNPTLVINWDTKANGPYVVVLRNLFDEDLYKVETPEKGVTINLADPKLASEMNISVDVRAKSDTRKKDTPPIIRRLTPAEHERVKKLQADDTSGIDENTAIGNILLASFYEQNKLLIDAIACYEKAMKLEPGAYKDDYEEFLLRNKIKVAPKP